MDESFADSDVSLSPTQILQRLQVSRKLQLLQREQVQRKQLEYLDSPEIPSSITEIVSHFSNSTSYNTFRSLLQSTEASNEIYSNSEHAGANISNLSKKDNIHISLDGVSVLDSSNVSDLAPTTLVSTKSSARIHSGKESSCISETNSSNKKQISFEKMPIHAMKIDLETLVIEQLKDETESKEVKSNVNKAKLQKKTFLRKGEGMARFGIQKQNLVIQNTKSLPWRIKPSGSGTTKVSKIIENKSETTYKKNVKSNKVHVLQDDPQTIFPLSKTNLLALRKPVIKENKVNIQNNLICKELKQNLQLENSAESVNNSKSLPRKNSNCLEDDFVEGKPPLVSNSVKTCSSVLTKEQDDFLKQLKQSAYYKNFVTTVKNIASDVSFDENHSKIQQERETAEQNMFELLENKVSNESFNINNLFPNQFLRQNTLECSGESTPIVMQKCLSKNPNLMHLLPEVEVRKNESTYTDVESYCSECSDCNDNCSSVSEYCSCRNSTNITDQANKNKEGCNKICHNAIEKEKESHEDGKTADNEVLKSNMVEMNSMLIATSALLKDRLRELEDEIETFRKENTNLIRMKDNIELERRKFYEEKNAFEQKFNEEKILSEYYLAEEKENLSKQKQMYARYVRDMRGKVNKKEKDEVINLKKEITGLREEIRAKDAKSTSTIARLRNQLKIIEKEKKTLEDEIEKLKKENKRIQHSNDISKRLTNIKALEEISKKLNNMTSKDAQSDIGYDSDIKYKANKIERQSRVRKILPTKKGAIIPRPKSLPNLKVTSRYAKYFSQKDSLSEKKKNKTFHTELAQGQSYSSNNDICNSDDDNSYDNCEDKTSDNEISNNLEEMYNKRFISISPLPKNPESFDQPDNQDFSFEKGTSVLSTSNDSISQNQPECDYSKPLLSINQRNSLSSRKSNSSKSPTSIYHEKCDQPLQRSKSSGFILSNRSSSSQKCGTVINKDTNFDCRMTKNPEPGVSTTSSTKANLNSTEIIKPDGTKEIRFPNGNVKTISGDGKYSKFVYYNGDIKENFYNEGRIKYYYAETKTFHTTHPDGLEILEFPDGQVEKRYNDGSSEIRLPNGTVRYYDPKNEHVREEWRYLNGTTLTISANGDRRIVFPNGQIEVHTDDHKRREFPDGTVKLVYKDKSSETRYSSGRVRIKDKHGNVIMDSATRQ